MKSFQILKGGMGKPRKQPYWVFKNGRIGGKQLLPKSLQQSVPKLLNKGKHPTRHIKGQPTGKFNGGLFVGRKTYKVFAVGKSKTKYADVYGNVFRVTNKG